VSDYESAQRRRNIVVGIFVILAVCALGAMIYQFGELPSVVSKLGSFQLQVQFPTATGVQKDTPVRFCGYQIGRVTSVKPPKVMKDLKTGNFYHQTLVILSIDNQYNDIPEDIEAKLMTRGLGSSYIELKLKSYDVNEPPGPFLDKGSLLQGSTGMTSEFFPEESQKKLEELVDGLRTLIDNANDIIGEPETKRNIHAVIANLRDATGEATSAINEFKNLSIAGTATLRNADARIETLVSGLTDASYELSKTASELRLLLEKVNRGEGSAARFVNDGKLYENLLESAEQMQMLLEELQSFVAQAREKGLPLKLK